jgi:hypothetical protein
MQFAKKVVLESQTDMTLKTPTSFARTYRRACMSLSPRLSDCRDEL